MGARGRSNVDRAAWHRDDGRRALRPHRQDRPQPSEPHRGGAQLNTLAWLVLAVTAAVAVVDWTAVVHSTTRLEYVAKPLVMAGLIAVALVLDPVSTLERNLFLAALALGLISDVFLMLPGDLLLPGLVAALVEHVAYIAGFRARALNVPWLIVAAVVASASAAVFVPIYIRALRRKQPKLVGPVLAYVAVFVVMVTSAGATGSLVALG